MSGWDEGDIAAKMAALIETAALCVARGLQSNTGGNLSVRLAAPDTIVIKPSGVGFAECTPQNLMLAGTDGSIRRGHLKPSKDLDFHAAIYRARPDVQAIVHVHSPWAAGWAAAGLEIPCVTVQALEKLGRLPLIPLSPEAGPQTGEQIAAVMKAPGVDGALLGNHGTIGLGRTLGAALHIAEIIEETAQVAFVREGLMAARGLKSAPLPARGVKAVTGGQPAPTPSADAPIELAVFGLHMSGMAMNKDLVGRGARLLRKTRTLPEYRLYALPGGLPERPGLIRVASGGVSIEAEVWALAPAAFGSFVAAILPPLTIGTVRLADGTTPKGYLCEAIATGEGRDISHHGSWRVYVEQGAPTTSR